MTSEANSAREDLAFMRSMVEDNGRGQLAFGLIYLALGLLYGGQLIVNWAQWAGRVTLSSTQSIGFILAVNLAVALVILLVGVRFRGARSGLAQRGVSAAFGGIGVAALALALVFGAVAARQHDVQVWMLYAPVAFGLQGAGWISSFMLSRRSWRALVGLGWLASAGVMGWFVRSPIYALTAAATFLVCMALPGFILVRLARRQA